MTRSRPGSRASRRWLLAALAAVTGAAAAIAGTPCPARAEPPVAILLPPGGHEQLRAPHGERARAAAEEVLEDEGFGVHDTRWAARKLRAAGEPACDELACARGMLEPAGAELAVAVAVWSRTGERGPRQVAVSLVGKSRAREVHLRRDVQDGDVVAATRAALGDGLGQWRGARPVPLVVQGRPEGATVTIDGRPVGPLPWRGEVTPGAHAVAVSKTGYATTRRDVRVDGDAGEAQVLRVELEAAGRAGATEATEASEGAAVTDAGGTATAGSDPERRDDPGAASGTRPSLWNWVIAGGLAAGGAAALVSPLRTLVNDGEQVSEDATSIERASFGAQSGVWLGVGVALIAAGATVAIIQPHQVEVSPRRGGATLQWTGRF